MPKTLAEVVLSASYSDDTSRLPVGGCRFEVWEDLPSDEFQFDQVEARGGARTLCATKRTGGGVPGSERIHIWVMPDTTKIWKTQPVILLVMADNAPGSLNYIVARAIPAEDRANAIKRAKDLNAGIIRRAAPPTRFKKPRYTA